ncbi:MAG: hypothetical protein IJF73_00985 [Clostridia bacterium]|nr:hypothetical protein [Clostridia bacterium]
MYHYSYSFYERDDGYGDSARREPDEIREEIELVRELLRSTQGTLRAAEKRREELLLSMGDELSESRERIRELRELCEECERVKTVLEELWDRADGLCEELEDTLFAMRGGVA